MQKVLSLYKNITLVFLLLIVFFIVFACNSKLENNSPHDKNAIDSVEIYISRSQDKSLDKELRKEELESAYQFNSKLSNDSIRNRNLLKIAFQAFLLEEITYFKKINTEALRLSIKLKDTFGIGDTHWNFANVYTNEEKMDSAYIYYYKAFKSFKTINNKLYTGKMLYNMAYVQGLVKDYTGAETSLFKAISIFKEIETNRSLYMSYNFLLELYIDLKEYDKAFFYHDLANKHVDLMETKGLNKEKVLNNLGLIYQSMGNHKEAVRSFEKALQKPNIKTKDINLYAKLVDNRAYNQLLFGDSTNLKQDFLFGLRIRDSMKDQSGVVLSKLHLGEYYAMYNDTVTSLENLKEAYKLAIIINNNRDVLRTLNQLSKIDIKNSKIHLLNYLSLTDSLQKDERRIRNKFTRIRFQTDEYIQETKYLTEQKKWILIISIFLFSTLSFLYYIKRQNAKNKELKFEREQQKANEEIYSLLLKHQAKMEEGRLQERNRISEDLHDGILGKLFGTRLSFGFLKLNGNETDLKKFDDNLSEMQQIEKEIRVISHELKSEILTSEFDFIDILNDLIQKQSRVGGFTYKLNNDKTIRWREISEKVKINLYRIILEGIQNITKYAKASQVKISFMLLNETVQLIIEDNGIGFNSLRKSKGIGLKNIQSRTQKLNGKFNLESKTNEGTKITISIPLKYKGHDKKV